MFNLIGQMSLTCFELPLPDRVTQIVLKINLTVGNLTEKSGNVFNAQCEVSSLITLGNSLMFALLKRRSAPGRFVNNRLFLRIVSDCVLPLGCLKFVALNVL